MKTPRIALCKSNLYADYMLILGICENVDGEEKWRKLQKYTLEGWKDHPKVGKSSAYKKHEKLQGTSVYFESIDLDVDVLWDGKHVFDLTKAKQYEITVEEKHKLEEELKNDHWGKFDILDWGK